MAYDRWPNICNRRVHCRSNSVNCQDPDRGNGPDWPRSGRTAMLFHCQQRNCAHEMAIPRHEFSLYIYRAYIWTGPFGLKGFYTTHTSRLARVSDTFRLSSRDADCDLRAFWLMVAVNAVSGILYFFFYHPPTFEIKFTSRTKMQQLKNFDYIGTFLFAAGLLLFMMGLSWGGSVSHKLAIEVQCLMSY